MKRFTGMLLIVISAAAFGTLAIFGRLIYADGVDTFTMLFLRFGFAALLMAVFMIARRERFPHGKILLALLGMGAIGYVGQSFTYLSAIKYGRPGRSAALPVSHVRLPPVGGFPGGKNDLDEGHRHCPGVDRHGTDC